MATDATPAVLWETRRTATGLLPSAPERLRRGGREEPSQELVERKSPSQQLCSNKRQRKERGRRAGAENIPLSHRHIVLAAGKGPGASATAPEAAPRRCAPAACAPAARQPAPSRGRANLLWFSKGCAGQFERLPFSREALRRVVLRNPHLRLICRTKTSSRHSSCRSGAGSPARHVLLAGAGDSGTPQTTRHGASLARTLRRAGAAPRHRWSPGELLCLHAAAQAAVAPHRRGRTTLYDGTGRPRTPMCGALLEMLVRNTGRSHSHRCFRLNNRRFYFAQTKLF